MKKYKCNKSNTVLKIGEKNMGKRCFRYLMLFAIVGICGCASTKTVTAEYVVLPESITNINEVRNLLIEPPVINFSGNYFKNDDLQIAKNYLTKSIAANIYKEGFYNVTDSFWGDGESTSLRKVQALLKEYNYPHGYDSISSDSVKCARLKILANININKEKSIAKDSIKLKNIRFKTEYVKGVPMSVPANTSIKVVNVNLKEVSLYGGGSIKAILYNNQGKEIYNKTFKNNNFSFKLTENKTPEALPTIIGLINKMFENDIKTIVADVSPHYI
jgi:hypothetical protein